MTLENVMNYDSLSDFRRHRLTRHTNPRRPHFLFVDVSPKILAPPGEPKRRSQPSLFRGAENARPPPSLPCSSKARALIAHARIVHIPLRLLLPHGCEALECPPCPRRTPIPNSLEREAAVFSRDGSGNHSSSYSLARVYVVESGRPSSPRSSFKHGHLQGDAAADDSAALRESTLRPPATRQSLVLLSTQGTDTVVIDSPAELSPSSSATDSLSRPSLLFSVFRRCFPPRGSARDVVEKSVAPQPTAPGGAAVVGDDLRPVHHASTSSGLDGGCRHFAALVQGSKAVVRSTGRLLGRAVMGTTVSSTSSPEPEDAATTADRVILFLSQKPLRMANMLKVTRMINDSSPEEKLALFEAGVVHHLCELIAECGSVERSRARTEASEEKRRRAQRRNSGIFAAHRGVGYGHGSTRSRWDIERTVEERLAREEHIIWLLSALTAYIYCANPDFSDLEQPRPSEGMHLAPAVISEIGESAVIVLLEYHLKNDSVFDVSEHMELYQALLETAACMSLVPGLVPYLVRPYTTSAKSISKQLVPKFKEIMSAYPNALKGQMGSPDFRLIDFINKIERYSEVVITAARNYERDLPPEQRISTATTRQPKTTVIDHSRRKSAAENGDEVSDVSVDIGLLYGKALKHLQMQTFRFIGDYGKLVVPFSFKKEARNVNPFSPSLKERTKRIAKELASMPNTLPLNASNSIYVCVDEGRCDIIKVLISGPDDTPYQNGLFEFDVFFPTSYPFSPPKCAFLTTGAGNVRFNPNLYNDGKICLSILGTWEGRPEEKWNPYCSLLQVLISIQGLIFVKEPYFNEPGFEKYQGTEKGEDYSRKYNLQIEHATLTYAIRDQLRNPPEHFKKVIQRHFWLKRYAIIEQAKTWLTEMRRDVAESEKHPKRKDSVSFDTIYNPFAQERVIQQLIDELTNMPCPVDLYEDS